MNEKHFEYLNMNMLSLMCEFLFCLCKMPNEFVDMLLLQTKYGITKKWEACQTTISPELCMIGKVHFGLTKIVSICIRKMCTLIIDAKWLCHKNKSLL